MYNRELESARSYLKSVGKTEYHLNDDEHLAEHLFKQLQELRQKINDEKVSVVEAVDAKYVEELNDLENQYATLLRMVA